jgi:hypothetical protein
MAQCRVGHGSVQGAVWLSSGCGVAQYRVRHGSVEGCSVGKLRVQRGPAPDYTIKAISIFFQKFAEIFAAQGAPPVSLRPVANGKNLQSEKFYLFLLDTFG